MADFCQYLLHPGAPGLQHDFQGSAATNSCNTASIKKCPVLKIDKEFQRDYLFFRKEFS